MINTLEAIATPVSHAEPFETRIDALFRELELAIKWQRPSLLLSIYSSEYVHTDAEAALENSLLALGQTVRRLKIRGSTDTDVASLVSGAGDWERNVFFVDGLRHGTDREDHDVFLTLNTRRDFFIENSIRIIFWLTEKEAIDLAHYAPDYWAFRHRVIEFVESPRLEQLPARTLEPLYQGIGEFTPTLDDLDDKISLRVALLTDLPAGDESTAPRANLLLTLGVLHWRKGDFEKAGEFLGEALKLAAKLNDNWFEALCYNAIALVETDLERIEEAIRAYQRAASLAPGQIVPWNNLGKLYNRLGRYPEALAAFQKAIESHPQDAISWNGLGDLYARLERPEDALLAYQKALEITPGFAAAWNGLGTVYAQLDQPIEAVSAYQKAIEIDRRLTASWIGLGRILKSQSDHENAIAVYKMASDLEPRNAQVWNELGDLYYITDAPNEAARAYRKAIELEHPCAQAYINLAALCTRQGHSSESIPLYQKAIDLVETSEEKAALWNSLGDACRRVNDYDNAIAAYRQADALDPQPVALDPQPIASPEADALDPQPATSPQAESPLPAEPDPEPPLQADIAEECHCEAVLAEAIPTLVEEIASADLERSPRNDTEQEVMIIEEPVQEEPKAFSPQAEPVGEECDFIEWLEKLSNIAPLPQENIAEEAEPRQELPTPDLEPEQDSLPLEPEPAAEISAAVPDSGTPEPIESADPAPTVPPAPEDPDEKNANAWNELGNIYFNAGAVDEAAKAFHKAIELDKDFGWPYSNLATVYAHKGRYTEAIPLYQKSIELVQNARDQALLWNHMGDAYRRLNDHDNAMAAYKKAMELDPSNTSLLTRARFSLLGNCKRTNEDPSSGRRRL